MSDIGQLSKHPDGYQMVLERVYDYPVQTVWDALTDPKKMTIWFTDTEWDFRPGGKIIFTFQDEEKTKSYGRIVTIQPPKILEFYWENDDGHPDELAHWELADLGGKTRLVLTYSKVREDLAPSVAAGWHIVLGDLGDFLGGKRDFRPFGGEGEFTAAEEAIKKEYTKIFNQLTDNK